MLKISMLLFLSLSLSLADTMKEKMWKQSSESMCTFLYTAVMNDTNRSLLYNADIKTEKIEEDSKIVFETYIKYNNTNAFVCSSIIYNLRVKLNAVFITDNLVNPTKKNIKAFVNFKDFFTPKQ
ncbi:hypothetical protein ALC152_03400 [Arcobacter sp. 15-2]|uniref:hypothetical protein n=1 Tax=Arcobacter sp. 15-2 TaxID=3374109 RepID=UPI00399D0C8F